MAQICKRGGECDGCMRCMPEQETCPVCREGTELIENQYGDVVGCEMCLRTATIHATVDRPICPACGHEVDEGHGEELTENQQNQIIGCTECLEKRRD